MSKPAELPSRHDPRNLVQWEENPRFEFDHEKEQEAERLTDPRDAVLLAEYMATGDIIKAAEAVGYPPVIAAKLVKTPQAIHWIRNMQAKRLTRLNIDQDQLVHDLNELKEDAITKYNADGNEKDRQFAKACISTLAELLGLGGKKDAPSGGTLNVFFGPTGTPVVAADPKPQCTDERVHRSDDAPRELLPVFHRQVEQGQPEEPSDIHDSA